MPYTGPTDDELKKRIAAWVKNYVDNNPKQKQLAGDLGVSEPTISNIMTGKVKPGFRMLVRLHFALGVELREVLRWREPETTRGAKPLQPSTPPRRG